MEDYKKKYERALYDLEIIKDANKDNKELVAFIEHEYPELKESEDERIRKAVKESVEYYWSDDTQARTDIIVWLEKQDPKKHEEELEKAYKTADEVQYRKGFEDGVAYVKPAEWSEEDEKMCQNLLECTRNCWRKLPTDVLKYESWLKSLRPKPKQEWSEETTIEEV